MPLATSLAVASSFGFEYNIFNIYQCRLIIHLYEGQVIIKLRCWNFSATVEIIRRQLRSSSSIVFCSKISPTTREAQFHGAVTTTRTQGRPAVTAKLKYLDSQQLLW